VPEEAISDVPIAILTFEEIDEGGMNPWNPCFKKLHAAIIATSKSRKTPPIYVERAIGAVEFAKDWVELSEIIGELKTWLCKHAAELEPILYAYLEARTLAMAEFIPATAPAECLLALTKLKDERARDKMWRDDPIGIEAWKAYEEARKISLQIWKESTSEPRRIFNEAVDETRNAFISALQAWAAKQITRVE
jgi:hypothetical protein